MTDEIETSAGAASAKRAPAKTAPTAKYVVRDTAIFLRGGRYKMGKKVPPGTVVELTADEARIHNKSGYLAPYVDDVE